MPKRLADETGEAFDVVGQQTYNTTSLPIINGPVDDYSCTNKRLHLSTTGPSSSSIISATDEGNFKQSSDLHRLNSDNSSKPLLDVTNDCATVHNGGEEMADGSHEGPLKLVRHVKQVDKSSSSLIGKQYQHNTASASTASVLLADETSRHLVRTVSDLPVFVTIEDYRVASYSINGEPHLCLPQLLQYIQQKFPLEKLVAKFEETVTNFVPATAKQIEGFTKASALPHDVKTCLLIKRSDAEWICLSLHDQQYSKGDKEEGVVDLSPDLKSKTIRTNCTLGTKSPTRGNLKSVHLEEIASNRVAAAAGANAASSLTSSVSPNTQKLKDDVEFNYSKSQEILTDKNDRPSTPSAHSRHDDSPSNSNNITCIQKDKIRSNINNISETDIVGVEKLSSLLNDNVDDHDKEEEEEEEEGKEEFTQKEQQKQSILAPIEGMSHVSPKVKTKFELECGDLTRNCVGKKQNLFESEVQNSILNLARAATSTLIIQVYHRCFGKCVGFYYPSLMKDTDSECIECSHCHKLLSPRRFIGHTHGAKELNVCHWGFNSYNWRHYIRLSKKQTLNNLDDDELLVQFNLLRFVSVDNKKTVNVDVLDDSHVDYNGNDNDNLDKQPPTTQAGDERLGVVVGLGPACSSQIEIIDHRDSSRHMQPGPSGYQQSSSRSSGKLSGSYINRASPINRHHDSTTTTTTTTTNPSTSTNNTSTPLSLRPIEEMTNFLITCNSNLLADHQANHLSRFNYDPNSRNNSPYPWPTFTKSSPLSSASSSAAALAQSSSPSTSSSSSSSSAAAAAAVLAASKVYQSSVPSLVAAFPLVDTHVTRNLFAPSSYHSLNPNTSNYQHYRQQLAHPSPGPSSLAALSLQQGSSFSGVTLDNFNYLNNLRKDNSLGEPSTSKLGGGVYTPLTTTTTNTITTNDPVMSGRTPTLGTRETPETLIKRDLFIISSLSEFLDSKGIPSNLTDDIVAHTLNSIRRSRSLF